MSALRESNGARKAPGRVLVIGGTGHVGAAVCRRLHAAGHAVAFTYHRNAAKAASLGAELDAPCRALDLGDSPSVAPILEDLANEHGGLDALVVASGLATAHQRGDAPAVLTWDQLEPAAFTRMLAVNVTGAFFACQWAGTRMRAAEGGRIVLIGSIDGVKPVPSPADYACGKAALVGMVQSLAKALGPHGILVNLVAPGILDGGIAALLSHTLHAEYLKHCTLKRVGTSDEVAQWVAFLVGPKNTYLTGQTVVLDGGL